MMKVGGYFFLHKNNYTNEKKTSSGWRKIIAKEMSS